MMKVPTKYSCAARDRGGGEICPWCYENLRRRANHVGHRFYTGKAKKPFVDWSTMFKRIKISGSEPVEGFECSDKKFLADYPTLAQGMCDPWGSDAKPRALWTLSVKMDGLSVQLTISDKSIKASAYTNAPSLAQALKLANLAAETDTLTWRKWTAK